ncbi:hypothetical protein [Nonlabens ponticola]|uniref:Uncharacterized protein n=1 Tax=Nonlabens ponticola TaxID=2496866 RepID=A0A3S9MXH1_9FLAO|nr:hypothetical protein [Nonlabens ponticola]AZQ43832.1 hypothetical protein EJ995_06165 [Nonlabens ponticola]
MSIIKKYASLVLLLLFLGVQATSLHGFSHEDDDTSCELCLVVQNFQEEEFTGQDAIIIAPPVMILVSVEVGDHYAFAKAESQPTFYPSRPPPFTHS